MIRANKQIEARAAGRLAEYETKYGEIAGPPVPLELIIERLFDLQIAWEELPDRPGAERFAAIRPAERKIILNQRHKDLFNANPGRERFSLGHELGHWDIYVDQAALFHPTIPGFELSSPTFHRTASDGDVLFLSELMDDPDFYAVYKQAMRGVDPPPVKTAVNRYASALLMPPKLMRAAVRPIIDRWDTWQKKTFNQQLADVYRIRDQFGVTISALKIRLDQLGLMYIAENDTIHKNRAEFEGQTVLPL